MSNNANLAKKVAEAKIKISGITDLATQANKIQLYTALDIRK